MLESDQELHRHRPQTNRLPEQSFDPPSPDDSQNQLLDDHPILIKKKKTSEALHLSSDNYKQLNLLHLPARSLTGHGESFLSMGFIDILRESTTLLRANNPLLMSILALLISPVSALLLSRPFLHSHLAIRLSSRLHGVASAAGLLQSSLNRSLFSSLAQIFLSHTFYSPALFSLLLLAKAAVIFTVACTYEGKKASLPMFVSVAFKLWKRLFFTYLCSCLVLLGFCSLTILVLLFVTSLLETIALLPSLVVLTDMALGVCFSLIFAQSIVIGNLANVVSILEEYCGLSALVRSLHLIRWKNQLALSLYFANTVGTVMVESLYQYRVIGTPESTYPVNIASRLWEGPLLVFMYSFLFLFHFIMTFVFYFTCKSAASTLSANQSSMEHISIAVDSADQQRATTHDMSRQTNSFL